MRKLIPLKNQVICKRICSGEKQINSGGIFLKQKYVDLFKIIDFNVEEKYDFIFKKDDIIMSQSTGDEIEVNDNDIYYLFQPEHIMCKIDDYEESN